MEAKDEVIENCFSPDGDNWQFQLVTNEDKDFLIAKFKSQQEAIKKLEEENKRLHADNLFVLNANADINLELSKLKQENNKLEEIIKEAINLPKGVEPHSYSDYLNKNK